jgi:hypothetical protein
MKTRSDVQDRNTSTATFPPDLNNADITGDNPSPYDNESLAQLTIRLVDQVLYWEQLVYTGAEEEVPDDCPEPLGKKVVMTTFFDANLYHDLVNGCSVTGILDLRIELRYLGVPIKGNTVMFGDKESVVNSSSIPHARLHKRHTALLFHHVRGAVATGVIKFHHVHSTTYPANILSKQWGYKQAWPLLQPLLFWEGDTMDIERDDDE